MEARQMTETQHHEIALPQGPIRYRDLGAGEPIVFVHGFLVDGRLWQATAEELAASFRCLVPDWPMGSHRAPMSAEADLSPPGMAQLIADFLGALELERATIVGNDSGVRSPRSSSPAIRSASRASC
jgi:pimeloyl-ACP methyl ester carboxylesterase